MRQFNTLTMNFLVAKVCKSWFYKKTFPFLSPISFVQMFFIDYIVQSYEHYQDQYLFLVVIDDLGLLAGLFELIIRRNLGSPDLQSKLWPYFSQFHTAKLLSTFVLLLSKDTVFDHFQDNWLTYGVLNLEMIHFNCRFTCLGEHNKPLAFLYVHFFQVFHIEVV